MIDDRLSEIEVVDRRTGEPADMSVLEDAQVAFDPTKAHLDLSKDEKRRTTALLMAVQAYKELIIQDAEMYKALKKNNEVTRPATINAMVGAAIQFDAFISGHYSDLPLPQPQDPDEPRPEVGPEDEVRGGSQSESAGRAHDG